MSGLFKKGNLGGVNEATKPSPPFKESAQEYQNLPLSVDIVQNIHGHTECQSTEQPQKESKYPTKLIKFRPSCPFIP